MKAAQIVVLMHGAEAAQLRRDRKGRLSIVYDQLYASDPAAVPLSLSLPFQPGPHSHERSMCWLASLLPDSSEVLREWGRRTGASADVFGLLATPIGHDCAGAVQFCPPERLDELCARPGGVEPLTDDRIASQVAAMALNPLRWTDDDIEPYFSLGGAQNKLALHRLHDRWARPCGSMPTTHILKPSHNAAKAVAIVEHLCLAAARRVDLHAAETTIEILDDHPVVIVERYDRRPGPSSWERIHQEDMCQALNIPGNMRREQDGGPGMAAIAGIIETHSTDPDTDLRRFADGLLWALVTINRDAHARNYSLTLEPSTVRLAPLYDLNSTLAYSSSGIGEREMAMRYGSRFTVYSSNSNHSLIDTAARLKLPAGWVIDRAESLAAAAVDAFTAEIDNLPHDAHEHLRAEEFLDSLRIRCESVSKTAAANRLRAATPRDASGHNPPKNATEYLLDALPGASQQRQSLPEQAELPDAEDTAVCSGTVETPHSTQRDLGHGLLL